MQSIADNPVFKKLLYLAAALLNYEAELKNDLHYEALGKTDNYKTFAEKAGFTAALNLYIKNVGAFLNNDFGKNLGAVIARVPMDITLENPVQKFMDSPELFHGCLDYITVWFEQSLAHEMDSIFAFCQSQLGLINNEDREFIQIGAASTFKKWIDTLDFDDIEIHEEPDMVHEFRRKPVFRGPRLQ